MSVVKHVTLALRAADDAQAERIVDAMVQMCAAEYAAWKVPDDK